MPRNTRNSAKSQTMTVMVASASKSINTASASASPPHIPNLAAKPQAPSPNTEALRQINPKHSETEDREYLFSVLTIVL